LAICVYLAGLLFNTWPKTKINIKGNIKAKAQDGFATGMARYVSKKLLLCQLAFIAAILQQPLNIV
jgi:hypothetical protein